MINIVGENINHIQLELYKNLLKGGCKVNVRGSSTVELYPVYIKLDNPRKRLTTLVNRRWNLPFAIGEVAWHLSGSKDFDFISYYSKNWKVALEDNEDEIRNSCYGYQIFSNNNKVWNGLITELLNYPNSRRAVISLLDSKKTLGKNVRDVACTSTIQFLIRNNKLDCIVNMRSNDIVWGLPNDIFFTTILQEWLAIILNVELGVYYHNVGSLHVYERHFELLENILKNPIYYDIGMPKMDNIHNIESFVNFEEQIRKSDSIHHNLDGYWGEMLNILLLRSNKVSNDSKRKVIKQSYYKEVLQLCPKDYLFNKTLNLVSL
ncbi:thymidylate synthase [Maribacter sp. PR1]|uniref:thymidylate synthase n=1 Tax=Maribacter cobaltidurans TaxID=1178778 RepID=A0ABU7IUE0_9FLAO|nr:MULTISPECIES: thymidylate synthase [Maribacter]MDC6389212.1 thymidylate synthase [Maribacter sp. PR1]MEE1976599.1 thymidylate synthase [Maribacter cobaltidurans]